MASTVNPELPSWVEVPGGRLAYEITAGGWKLDADGMLAIPTAPGLGLTLDHDAVRCA